MSSRARRVASGVTVTPFTWGGGRTVESSTRPRTGRTTPPDAGSDPAQLAVLERDAFSKGFAQGERAGLEAASQRGEAMLKRLTQTLEELATLRAQMIHQTERQMVQLALAVARRVVHREISLDHDLLVAMARVALDRLGDTAHITVRLNPEDFEVTGAARAAQLHGSHVTVVADARIARGGCRIESDLGVVDAGVDAQLQELAHALLGDREDATADALVLG